MSLLYPLLLAALLAGMAAACTTPTNREPASPTTVGQGTLVVDVSRLWKMAPRAGAHKTPQGATELAGDFADYPVTPSSYALTLDASSLLNADPGIRQYNWTLDGQTVATTRTATVAVTTLGAHRLGLTVGDASGHEGADLQTIDVSDRLIVAMGDSVASGEGNPDVFGQGGAGFQWENPRCDRSGRSYGEQASEMIQAGDPHTSVTFASVACSGAATGGTGGGGTECIGGNCFNPLNVGGIMRPYPGAHPPSACSASGTGGLPPCALASQIDQVKQLVGNRPIDDLLVTIGANDLNFHGIALDCAFPLTECEDNTGLKQQLQADLNGLSKVGGSYDQLAAAIGGLNVRRVWITTYFDPTTNTDGSICPDNTILGDAGEYAQTANGQYTQLVGGHVSSAEASFVSSSLIAPLNADIEQAAVRNHWNVIGSPSVGGTFAAQFKGHGYCAQQPWVVRAFQSANQEGPGVTGDGTQNTMGSLHPNLLGTAAYARLTANRLSTGGPKVTITSGLVPVSADCAGGDGWLSGMQAIGQGTCQPDIGYTVTADNPSHTGQPQETDGVYTGSARRDTEGPQLSKDGVQISFDSSNPTKWTCPSAAGLTCELDVTPNGVDLFLTLQTEGIHEFEFKAGNGLGVSSESVWTAKADWTPPNTAVHLAPGTSTAVSSAFDSGSGVAHVYYELNGGARTVFPSYGVPMRSGDVLLYWATDVAGNIETPHSVTLAGTPPQLTAPSSHTGNNPHQPIVTLPFKPTG